ncbi:DNA repair protein XRCC1-like isoform X9 [Lycorma delicatula]|uniref:DNA repair protein XRCC1-like isoform X9 n=1 Tax=Lycorma delicatula TaxID=130591 RepID=UPI003F511B57
MPLAEIESVVSVSTQDPLHPAKNLLTSAIGSDIKKWICQKKGEKDLFVTFKLKERANITNITVGNENTAIIEVLVGNDDTKEKEYQVLLPTTEIQTIHDVRAGRNKNAVHFFTTKDFNKDVRDKLWERIKVVCNQPYDLHIRYGLSCFVVKSIKDESDNNSQTIVQVKKEEEKHGLSDDEKQKLKEWKYDVLQRLTPDTSASSSQKQRLDQNNISPHKKKNLHDNPAEASYSNKVKKESEENNISHEKKDIKNILKKKVKSTPSKKDFSKIFDGVKFSMSGYENPLRSVLRSKALEMGAKYSNDWDSSCTHLICAFLNTPKFNQVKSQGLGKIVTKDWIEECYKKRRRLPWRRFATDVRERQLPESEEDEEEMLRSEGSHKKEVDRRRRLPSSSSDTEDEIERIRARKVRKLKKDDCDDYSSDKPNDNSTNKNVEDLYNADTDESEHSDGNVAGQRPDTSDLPLPPLPNIPSHNYFISKDEKGEYRRQLERYIHAFKGKKGFIQPIPSISHIFGEHCFYIGSDLPDIKKERIKKCIDSFQWNIYDNLCDEVEFAITDDEKIAKQKLSTKFRASLKFEELRYTQMNCIFSCKVRI